MKNGRILIILIAIIAYSVPVTAILCLSKEEAKKYTTGCCDSRIYTVDEDAACPHNAAKLSNDVCYWGGKNKYRCACDRGRYQYSTIQGE